MADRREWLMPALVVLLSVVGVVAATRAPFRSDSDGAGVRVVVDHVAGARLADVDLDIAPARIESIEVRVDNVALARKSIPADGPRAAVGFADWDIEPGSRRVEVVGMTATEPVTLYDRVYAIEPGQRLVLSARDVPPAPGSSEGRDVFNSRAAGCQVCHSTRRGDDGVGPSLYGVASVAASRVPGLDAELYLRQSILLPDQYIVDGWPAGQMLPIYRERLDETQLEALILYLLTLTDEGES